MDFYEKKKLYVYACGTTPDRADERGPVYVQSACLLASKFKSKFFSITYVVFDFCVGFGIAQKNKSYLRFLTLLPALRGCGSAFLIPH